MKIQKILQTTAHRPWQLPYANWKFYQEWNNAVFLHYQVDLEELQKWVPAELEIDLFKGSAWVSVVAFTMENIRPKHLPPFSPISDFHEINIRTYVKCNNKAGVYFLSIEGGKSISCKVAKAISELPYRYSNIKRTATVYESQNSVFKDHLKIHYAIGKQVTQKTALELWLTERYALFQDTATAINEFEIHHIEWPVHQLQLQQLEVHYPRFSKLLNQQPAAMQYSKGVQVLAWGKVKTNKAGVQ